MVPFERALVSSYRPFIVTFHLSVRVSEILPLLFSRTPLFPTQPQIAAFDPPTPKALARTKHGVYRMHRLRDRYSPLNYIVTFKLGSGHSRSSKAALFDKTRTTLYSSFIVTRLYLLPFPR